MAADRDLKKSFISWIKAHRYAPAIIRDKLERALVKEPDKRDALRLFIKTMEALKRAADAEIENAERWIRLHSGEEEPDVPTGLGYS